MSAMESSSVQVVVRMRPLNDREKKGGTLPVVTASTEKKEIVVIKGAGNRQQRTTYNFDNVLGTASTQEEVFQQTIEPVIADVLGGFECTMFAYGQTGTGKTHTMEGDLSSGEQQGVIPRAAQAIFDMLGDPKFRESEVTASYLEIYNEELSDLLVEDSKHETKLQICEDNKPRGKGLFVQNLSETTVKTPEDVLGLMQRAQLRRQVGETKMNKQSSRSHCLFTLKVHSKKIVAADGAVMECTGKLHLVDLAGSECAKTAGTDKVDLAKERERKNINQSLLTLGRVISALREGPTGRIPYRDSKLTRLLQESLGGRCKTVIIATVSPSVLAVDETISTLNYAQAAHGIQNKPVATSYLKLGDGKPRPESAGGAGGAGLNVQDWNQMECRLQYMQAELEEAQAALSRKHLQQQVIIDRAEAAEKDRDNLALQLQGAKEDLEGAFSRNNALLQHLKLTREDVARVQRLVEVRKGTEKSLTAEASEVLEALARCVADGENFHAQLVEQAAQEAHRRAQSKQFHSAAVEMLTELGSELHKYAAEVAVHLKAVVDKSKAVEAGSTEQLAAVLQAATDMESHVVAQAHKARQIMEHGIATTAQQLQDMQAASMASGEEVCSTAGTCQQSVKVRMEELQRDLAQSEAALDKWAEGTSAKLQETTRQLSEMLGEHGVAIQANKLTSEALLEEMGSILGEQKVSLGALAASLVAQGELEQRMGAALASMSSLCVQTAAAHVDNARKHAEDLDGALQAQREGQLDGALQETLEKARAMAGENAAGLTSMCQAQKQSLQAALEQQEIGTIDGVHGCSIEATRMHIETSSADLVAQMEAQRVQLEGARDEQRTGNAQLQHSVAIEALRGEMASKIDVERGLVGELKMGLEKAADDLEAEKQDESKLIETLQAESDRLRAIVEQQRATLQQQKELLETQHQQLASALAVQKEGQARMIEAMEEELRKVIEEEKRVREEEATAQRARAAEEAERLRKMLEAENRMREDIEAAARARQAQALASLQQLLSGQVSGLAASMEADVSGLVGINQKIASENTNVKEQAEGVDECMVQLQEQASLQVRVWGQASAAVQANIRDLSIVNATLAEEVEEVSALLVKTCGELQDETAAWGKSNKVVEEAVIEAITNNVKTSGDTKAMKASMDEQAACLQAEKEQWRESNHAVAEQIKSIVKENEAIAGEVSRGSSEVDAVQVEAVGLVKAWGESDRTCQASMQQMVQDTNALADTMQADQVALHAQQGAAAQQLAQLAAMTVAAQGVVEQHTVSNTAAQSKTADMSAHVVTAAADAGTRITGVESVQCSAIEEVKSSVANMIAPRPEFLASLSRDGQLLLADVEAAVSKTSELVASHQAGLEAARASAVSACEDTKQSHVAVLEVLDAGAASQRERAVEATEKTKVAMAAGPAAATAEADALSVELASVEKVHGEGSSKLGGCVSVYCVDVARMEEAVPPAPQLGSFNTAVTFSSTEPDEAILSNFAPVIDMSDISSPEQQVPPEKLEADLPAALLEEPADADMERPCEPAEEEAPQLEVEAADCGEGRECDKDEAKKGEKKRARMATPKRSDKKIQKEGADITEKPAAKIAATGNSRLPGPKARTSLRELNH